MVSPWVESGSVYNEEYRHTSLIATLRKAWGLGEAFSQRDASARTFDHVFLLDTLRDPQEWATAKARPLPEWTMDIEAVGESLSQLSKAVGPGLIAMAKEMGVTLPPELDDPGAELKPGSVVPLLRDVAHHFFPLLAGDPGRRA